jgi:hypothetical protein
LKERDGEGKGGKRYSHAIPMKTGAEEKETKRFEGSNTVKTVKDKNVVATNSLRKTAPISHKMWRISDSSLNVKKVTRENEPMG